MIKDTISDSMINLVLRQLGATSIKTKPAHINIAKFDIGAELRVTYLYEVKEGEGAYLQRVDPYPMMIGKLYNEDDIIYIIKKDLAKFKRAYNSKNFKKFLEVANNLVVFEKDLENLFLLKNVLTEDLEQIDAQLAKAHSFVEELTNESEPVT